MAGPGLGAAELFCDLHRDKFLYVHNTGDWLVWDAHHWTRDCVGAARGAVEKNVIRVLIDAANKHLQKPDGDAFFVKKIEQVVRRLRTPAGIDDLLKMAVICPNNISICGDELDNDPDKLGCANGIIDLRTGILFSGVREDYVLKAAPTEYRGFDYKSELWEKTVLEIMSGFRAGLPIFTARPGLGHCGRQL